MKLITLNTWGGTLLDQLLSFLKEQSTTTDIFCLQEIYNSNEKRKIGREMQSDLFEQITEVLPDFEAHFKPQLKGYDLEGKVDFDLSAGIALFIKKGIEIKTTDDIWIHREGHDLINEDNATVARNLQYVDFVYEGQHYTVAHFHGVWYPKTKLDNDERLEQSRKIKEFLDTKTGKKILCGDFNLLPTTESMKILEAGNRNLITEYNIESTRTEHYKREEKHADYILVSPEVNVIDFGLVEEVVSDHYPLMLKFD
ncbi:MAG: endonuclease/exonuclease/phosphatase family protein [Weeksellaceae bacterium]